MKGYWFQPDRTCSINLPVCKTCLRKLPSYKGKNFFQDELGDFWTLWKEITKSKEYCYFCKCKIS